MSGDAHKNALSRSVSCKPLVFMPKMPVTSVGGIRIAVRTESSGATSMREHWQSGLEDTRRTLKRRGWLALPGEDMAIAVHDVRERDY